MRALRLSHRRRPDAGRRATCASPGARTRAATIIGGEFDAERLDIGVMAEIATRVPIGSALRALLADVHPRGVISQLRTALGRPARRARALSREGPAQRALAGGARRRPRPMRSAGRACATPTLQLEASEAGGQARIDMQRRPARSARRVRGARAAARPARRQADLEDRAAMPAARRRGSRVRVARCDASPTPTRRAS